MERADWLDERVNSADARFLMVTAITHHRFSSPIWGAREVRKLQAELAEITKHASEILREHQRTAKPTRRGPAPQLRAGHLAMMQAVRAGPVTGRLSGALYPMRTSGMHDDNQVLGGSYGR